MKKIVISLLILLSVFCLSSCKNEYEDVTLLPIHEAPIVFNESFEDFKKRGLWGYIYASPYVKDITQFENINMFEQVNGTFSSNNDEIQNVGHRIITLYEFYILDKQLKGQIVEVIDSLLNFNSYHYDRVIDMWNFRYINNFVSFINQDNNYIFGPWLNLQIYNNLINILNATSMDFISYYYLLNTIKSNLEHDCVTKIVTTCNYSIATYLNNDNYEIEYRYSFGEINVISANKPEFISSKKDEYLRNGRIYGFCEESLAQNSLIYLNGGEQFSYLNEKNELDAINLVLNEVVDGDYAYTGYDIDDDTKENTPINGCYWLKFDAPTSGNYYFYVFSSTQKKSVILDFYTQKDSGYSEQNLAFSFNSEEGLKKNGLLYSSFFIKYLNEGDTIYLRAHYRDYEKIENKKYGIYVFDKEVKYF